MSNSGVFNFKWFLFSIAIFLVVQVFLSILFVLFGFFTFGLGFLLFLILKPLTYYFGGYMTALFSPGITIREPAAGALAVTVLGSLVDAGGSSGGHFIGLVISGAVAYFCALWGARSGE
ncbi:MAG: hypothetical protein DRP59_06530 [Spirochaetes bacterium]|nr:MAG: hypothetical protein DRP59_06530 [Spirochaetota bacterium]